MLDHVRGLVGSAALVEVDSSASRDRCRRDILADPERYDMEMKQIFKGNWI